MRFKPLGPAKVVEAITVRMVAAWTSMDKKPMEVNACFGKLWTQVSWVVCVKNIIEMVGIKTLSSFSCIYWLKWTIQEAIRKGIAQDWRRFSTSFAIGMLCFGNYEFLVMSDMVETYTKIWYMYNFKLNLYFFKYGIDNWDGNVNSWFLLPTFISKVKILMYG